MRAAAPLGGTHASSAARFSDGAPRSKIANPDHTAAISRYSTHKASTLIRLHQQQASIICSSASPTLTCK
eukprot:NODE_28940_length_461_cov_3.341317.p2 GENE.NODE_28940_length_461_cov_3.341317~~NODE_28940_length_461_cov_3.341317.p2  ORF type:complete len:70 (-),score=7.17 NODE_28940_length_461_cov_3.341317:80-289(-)